MWQANVKAPSKKIQIPATESACPANLGKAVTRKDYTMKKTKGLRSGILLITMLFLSTSWACVSTGRDVKVVKVYQPRNGPPAHAPAHGYRAKYRYRYYPTVQVYFDVSRSVYFYLDDGRWIVSASLPRSIRVRLGDYAEIGMETDRPYTKFKEHKKKYPPGQLKKKKHHWKKMKG